MNENLNNGNDPNNRKDVNNHEDEEEEQIVDGSVEVIELNDADLDEEEDMAEEMIEMGLDEFLEEVDRANAELNEPAEEMPRYIEDNSLYTLKKHNGAVFCLDAHNNLLATGGEDDQAFLWKIKSEVNNNDKLEVELVLESEKFQDSVTNVKFSCDGKYLAVSDMSGKIRVYVNDTKELFWSHDIEMDIETLSWHPNCNVLFCSTSDGYFMMFKISTNEIKMMYFGDNVVLSCFRILKDGKRAVCAYNNGNIRIVDLKSGQPEHNILNAHENEIICMDLSSDGNLLATGGVDMKVKIINTTNGKIVSTYEVPVSIEKSEEENSIESVGFCKIMQLLACVTLSGELFVWDLNTRVLRNKLENSVGYSKILWNNQELLFASTLDGVVQCYDGRNLQLVKRYSGHESEILDFCFDKDHLFTASNDNFVKVFKIN